jgi:hypothetical protein
MLVEDMLAKVGLMLTIFFCLTPIPIVFRVFTSDKDAIKSISLPGVLMQLSSGVIIGSYCAILRMDDCVYGNMMGIASGAICLLAIVI